MSRMIDVGESGEADWQAVETRVKVEVGGGGGTVRGAVKTVVRVCVQEDGGEKDLGR